MKNVVWTLVFVLTILAVTPSVFACGMSKDSHAGGEEAEASAE